MMTYTCVEVGTLKFDVRIDFEPPEESDYDSPGSGILINEITVWHNENYPDKQLADELAPEWAADAIYYCFYEELVTAAEEKIRENMRHLFKIDMEMVA